MKKSSKSSTKKQPTAAEYTRRLGPVRKVVRLGRASDTGGSYNLHLECKHVPGVSFALGVLREQCVVCPRLVVVA